MLECPNCHSHDIYGVMYAPTSPNYNPHEDHISAYQCGTCGKTFGRWTRRELPKLENQAAGPVQYEEEKVWGGAESDPEEEEIGEPIQSQTQDK